MREPEKPGLGHAFMFIAISVFLIVIGCGVWGALHLAHRLGGL